MSSPSVSVPKLIPAAPIYSDVIRTLVENAVLIAERMRTNYLKETNNLVAALRGCLGVPNPSLSLNVASVSPTSPDTANLTEELLSKLRGMKVAALDGGQGTGLLGAETPFIMRSVTYSVKLGDKAPDRESFSPSYFLVNKLSGGALGAGESLIAAVQVLFELGATLRSIQENPPDMFLLHGPLERATSVFLADTYNMAPSDLVQIVGSDTFKLYSEWEKDLTAEQQKQLKVFPTFGCMVFVLNRIIDLCKEKGILLCGVVERTRSTELLQRAIFTHFDTIYPSNKAWFDEVVGYEPGATHSQKSRYIKCFLDRLGYTDLLIFGCLLAPGQYFTPLDSRSNRYQSENELLGIETGFIDQRRPLSELVPKTVYTYVRTSPFNAPFKIEFPAFLTNEQREKVVQGIYAFSQFLPKYAFPVNLDVVDKVAKVPNWITNGLMALITQEIYKSSVPTELSVEGHAYSMLLGGKSRDWELRPGVRKKLV